MRLSYIYNKFDLTEVFLRAVNTLYNTFDLYHRLVDFLIWGNCLWIWNMYGGVTPQCRPICCRKRFHSVMLMMIIAGWLTGWCFATIAPPPSFWSCCDDGDADGDIGWRWCYSVPSEFWGTARRTFFVVVVLRRLTDVNMGRQCVNLQKQYVFVNCKQLQQQQRHLDREIVARPKHPVF